MSKKSWGKEQNDLDQGWPTMIRGPIVIHEGFF